MSEHLLEAILVNQDNNSKSNERLLEHLLVQNNDNKPHDLLEASLVLAEKNTQEIVKAIKDIPEIKIPEQKEVKIPEFPKEIKVSNQIETKTLEEKISAVETAIREREDKEIDLNPVIKLLKEIRDKEDAEISIPDLSGKIDELIAIIKKGQIIEISEKNDEINYTKKFDTLIEEIKKIAKRPDFGHQFAVVDIRNRAGAQVNPATEEKQDTANSSLATIATQTTATATNTAALAMSVENALSTTTYDLNAAAYSGTTAITSDYELDSIVLDFSTTQSKTITITTAQGTKLYEDTNTTQNLVISFNQKFNASENITVAVTQTAGACTMDLRLKITKGSSTLLGNTSLGSSTERIGKVDVRYEDSENLDAFGRLRSSSPTAVFDNQFTYDLAPLVFEQITSGTGASIAHDATNREAVMTFASTPTGGVSKMQSYNYIRYQPGKSQKIDISFNFVEAVANTLKFVGYSDGVNGMEFQLNGTTKQFVIYSGTTNGNQTVTQANWNLDKLDGTGTSGITLDITKKQILIIDFQALYAGRVRFGFNIGGKNIYAHEINHANTVAYAFIQDANLPIRCGMTCTGTVSTTVRFGCSSVASEGGLENIHGYEFAEDFSVTAGNGVRTHGLSIRPRATFNGIVNRASLLFIEIDLIVTGNNPVEWELCFGQALTGTTTFSDVNTTYSAMEFNTAGTISGDAAIIADESYVPSSNQSKGQGNMTLTFKYPVTLDAAGNPRVLGTLSLVVTGIGGSSACRGALKWVEIR